MAECFASVSEDELCEKCIIKQLLNSVFAWYHELDPPWGYTRGVTGKTFTDTENKTEKSTHFPTGIAIRQPSNYQNLVSVLSASADLGFDNSWYHAQPHPIIVYYWMRLSIHHSDIKLSRPKFVLSKSKAEADNTNWDLDNYCYHAKPNPIIIIVLLRIFLSWAPPWQNWSNCWLVC